ncbi:MAG: sucrose phosphorylase [Alkaliphilus sp.]|nr:MAG: sucrose phosphorylase [Alkaliphilus sp.]
MELKNEIMLITYPNSLGENIEEMSKLVNTYFEDVIGGIHLLPFYPSSADRGFAPLTYKEVDDSFGKWEEVEELSQSKYMMYDFMLNHISRKSEYFQDFLRYKEKSEYKELFINFDAFWGAEKPTQKQIDMIYKRKPRAPYISVEFADGSKENIWCTFDEEQIDLNLASKKTLEFVQESVEFLCQRGASIIRIDAFAYATKRIDTNCFFIEPDTWDYLKIVKNVADKYGAIILPEIHEHYSIQLKIADKGYWVYDFALPMLVLHSLYSGKGDKLKYWLKIAPKNQFTTLDTHDGIGVVDAKDLLSDEEIDFTKQKLFSKGANVKKIYNTEAYNNLDIYQINCTYYSALGNNDDAYLLARAIQFFAPGIPQVYYVGMLAGENDTTLVERTKFGRDINRHNYTEEEIKQEVLRPVVKKLFQLMKFRNTYKAFDGEVEVLDVEFEKELKIQWKRGDSHCILEADLISYQFSITYYDVVEKGYKELVLAT